MVQTIFFALFRTSTSNHDRMELFQEEKNLEHFFNWSEYHRKKIETQTKTFAVIHSFKIERYETNE